MHCLYIVYVPPPHFTVQDDQLYKVTQYPSFEFFASEVKEV